METERRDGIEINIRKLVFACLDKWWLIVLCAVIAATAAGLVTAKMIQPKYRSTVTMYVNNASNYEKVNYISSSNLSAAEQLVSTYIGIISTDTVLEQVGKQAGGMTAGQVRACLATQQVGETVLFRVGISHTDPATALRIARAVEDVMPDALSAIVEGSSTKVVDRAKLATAPYSPNIKKNCMMGGAVGSMVAVLIIVLLHILDVRIKDEEDLIALSKYPVLGQVPEFTGDSKDTEEGRTDTKTAKRKGDNT
ncbi:MAG: hypothetical protein IJB75_05635 [Oscillospiraceae bacterium]|nr:hypothetical protein [Oscillospiraceae bacterium]